MGLTFCDYFPFDGALARERHLTSPTLVEERYVQGQFAFDSPGTCASYSWSRREALGSAHRQHNPIDAPIKAEITGHDPERAPTPGGVGDEDGQQHTEVDRTRRHLAQEHARPRSWPTLPAQCPASRHPQAVSSSPPEVNIHSNMGLFIPRRTDLATRTPGRACPCHQNKLAHRVGRTVIALVIDPHAGLEVVSTGVCQTPLCELAGDLWYGARNGYAALAGASARTPRRARSPITAHIRAGLESR